MVKLIIKPRKMNLKNIFTQARWLLLGSCFCITTLHAEAVETTADTPEVITPNAKIGQALFEGSQPFENGGPSCIVCHNVTHSALIPGGLFAKDLTDVYERLGEGLSGWLMAPPFKPMAASYNNTPLTTSERTHLTAFFKVAYETKDDQEKNSGYTLFLIGGGAGVIGLLLLIQLLWMNRKKKMVKQDIFSRQKRAADAKF